MGKGKRQKERREKAEARRRLREAGVSADEVVIDEYEGIVLENEGEESTIKELRESASPGYAGGYRIVGEVVVNGRGQVVGRYPDDFVPKPS